MSTKNRISAVITPEQLQASTDAIVAFKANLSNVLTINLQAQERRRILKMGNKTLTFVEKTLEYAKHNPSLVPNFMDLEEARKDYELAASLYDIFQQLNTLMTSVEDAGMVAGSEAYEARSFFITPLKVPVNRMCQARGPYTPTSVSVFQVSEKQNLRHRSFKKNPTPVGKTYRGLLAHWFIGSSVISDFPSCDMQRA